MDTSSDKLVIADSYSDIDVDEDFIDYVDPNEILRLQKLQPVLYIPRGNSGPHTHFPIRHTLLPPEGAPQQSDSGRFSMDQTDSSSLGHVENVLSNLAIDSEPLFDMLDSDEILDNEVQFINKERLNKEQLREVKIEVKPLVKERVSLQRAAYSSVEPSSQRIEPTYRPIESIPITARPPARIISEPKSYNTKPELRRNNPLPQAIDPTPERSEHIYERIDFRSGSINDNLLSILEQCEETLRPCDGIQFLDEVLYRRDFENNTLLHWTIAVGWVHVTISIIRHTSCSELLNMRNDMRQTALILACFTQQSPVVAELMKAGADLSLIDRHGDSAYHIAARNGDLETLHVLCPDMSTDLVKVFNTHNSDGHSAVHLAAIKGHIHILSFLNKIGADMNRKDGKAGYTPLHHAIRTHRDTGLRMVQFLTERVAVDLSVKDYCERTPLMFAEFQRCRNQVAYLVMRGPGRDWLNCPPCSDEESDLEDDDMRVVEA